MTSFSSDRLTEVVYQIVSATPGRIRLKVNPSYRHPETLEAIAEQIQTYSIVSDLKTNPKTGSIIIYYPVGKSITPMLEDLGLTVETSNETPGRSVVSNQIIKTVYATNRGVKQTMRGVLDLRILIPIIFAMLSIRKLMLQGLQLDIIPWYVLAWYSFDSFLKLHYTSEPKQS